MRLTWIVIILLAIAPTIARGEPQAMQNPLAVSAAAADDILLVRLTSVAPDSQGTRSWLAVGPPASYGFSVIASIKGGKDVTSIHLPSLDASFYQTNKLPFGRGTFALLILKSQPNGLLVPEDSDVPIIFLGKNPSDFTSSTTATATIGEQVVGIVLDSLVDPTYRRSNISFLRYDTDPRIPKAFAAYINDPDVITRDIALYAVGRSQNISVIPQIAQLADQNGDNGCTSVMAIASYRVAEAVPYLNPLVFDQNMYVRLNSLTALYHIADTTSEPYLLLGMRDATQHGIAAYLSYHTFQGLVGDNALPEEDTRGFAASRLQLISKAEQWWSDDLAGKHVTKADVLSKVGNSPPQATPASDSEVPTARADLLKWLFSPIVDHRQRALQHFRNSASLQDAPYLLVCLDDPDNGLSFQAAQCLAKLTGITISSTSINDYGLKKESDKSTLFAWWTMQLMPATPKLPAWAH